jgi:hypothetical protein
MNSSDLLFTHDKQTNAIIGGGYTLNSSFLNANVSPFVQMKGGSRRPSRRNKRNKSDRSDSNDDDDDDDHNHDDEPELKVSTLLERANSSKFIIPAGIFMIHPTSHTQDQEHEPEHVPMSSKLKEFIYSPDHKNDDNYDHQDQVVPSDLYEKLLSMISPADKKRYWDPKSSTRKKGNRNQEIKPGSPSSNKSKTRRKV